MLWVVEIVINVVDLIIKIVPSLIVDIWAINYIYNFKFK